MAEQSRRFMSLDKPIDKFIEGHKNKNTLSKTRRDVRPGSDAVLHMSRIEFNELSSCEVRRLNQFETADIIRIGLAVLHAWLGRE